MVEGLFELFLHFFIGFVRPAFDAKADEAYEKVKKQLRQALDSRGLL